MSRSAQILFLLLVALLPARAMPAALPAPLLTVTEKTEAGQSIDCPAAQALCHADIASTLHVVPDISPLLAAGTPAMAANGPAIASQRQDLLTALDHLQRSMVLSRQILEIVANGGGGPVSAQGKALSGQYEAETRSFIRSLRAYARANSAEFALSPNATDLDVDRQLGRTSSAFATGKLGDWIAGELRKVDQLAATQAAVLKERSQLAVRLGAFRVRAGAAQVALHLPGYDDIPAGKLTPFERITFDVSAADQKQLAEELKFENDVVAKIESLRQEAAKDGGALKAIVAEAKTFADVVQKNLAKSLQDLEDAGQIPPALTDLRASVDGLKQSLQALQSSVGALETALDTSVAGTGAQQPDVLLLQLLGELKVLKDGKPLTDVVTRAGKVRDSAELLKSRIAAASTELKQKLQTAVQEAASVASKDAGPLFSLLDLLKSSDLTRTEETAANLGDLLKVQMSDPQRFDVSGDQLQATDLQILRADAQRGDVIELVAEVRRKAAAGSAAAAVDQPPGEVRRSIRVDVYGWSSGVASGLGMIKAKKTDLSNFKPAAIAVWRIGFRSRPEDPARKRLLGALQPGVGIHAATLDFDPNASVELGAGVALHLFSDLVQVGYGWNLNVKKDRGYWYLGIGLFNLLKGK